ncbi:MAG: hypothetical protein AB8H79_01600 [Myxococcota bacterium]
MDKADFRILVRRVPGYEPSAAVRFEMREGYGELHIGDRNRASPAAQGEISEAACEQVRMGRFVHVLSSGKRRQSYSLSRLDDDRIQRLSEDKWIQLVPLTEFGIRYLDLPSAEDSGAVAAVKLSGNPSPPRSHEPVAKAASTAAPSASSSLLARARSSSNKQQRRSSSSDDRSSSSSSSPAPRRPSSARAEHEDGSQQRSTPPISPNGSDVRGSSARPPSPRATSARPQPVARIEDDAPTESDPEPLSMAIDPALGTSAVERLSKSELQAKLIAEMGKVAALQSRIAELQRDLENSHRRESDMVGLIAKWTKNR